MIKTVAFDREYLAEQLPESASDNKPLLRKLKLSEDDFEKVKNIAGRSPTLAELSVFSSMWSEHCSYKSSRVHLARLPTEGPAVVVGPGENAGVVRVSGKLCAVFKMESHNHPSFIEPYQGAATGVGGILRDVFCMGARPIANLNCLRFGERDADRMSYLFDGVVRGIGDYGNCIGVATVGGDVAFHPAYNGNILVNAMTVGLIHEDRIFKGYASGAGNWVVYAGSATGRDGIHGASMASDRFDSTTANERSTVQVGDPFAEKLLLEATLDALEQGLVVGLQDMGAAGLTSSAFEMADRAGNGLYLDLDLVPVRADKMRADELLLSESQERMLFVIEPSNWQRFKDLLEHWELSYAVIGQVTESGRMQIRYQDQWHVDLPVAPLAEKAPKLHRRLSRRLTPSASESALFDSQIIHKIRALGSEYVFQKALTERGSKQPVYQQYDHHIGTRTVYGPECGGAAVLWLRSPWAEDQKVGLVVAAGCLETYCAADPKLGASHSLLACARKIAAAGGRGIAVTDCLNFGNPEDPKVMSDFAECIDGIAEAARNLSTPVVSGNVSLYNETDGRQILPTPMIGMVGKIADVTKAVPGQTELSDVDVYLLCYRRPQASFGGGLSARLLGFDASKGAPPEIHWEAELEAMTWLESAAAGGLLESCRDVGLGGLLLTCAKLLPVEKCDVKIDLESLHAVAAGSDAVLSLLFGELPGSYLCAVRKGVVLNSTDSHTRLVKIASTSSVKAGRATFDYGLARLKGSTLAELSSDSLKL